MKKTNKNFYLMALGAFFILIGILISMDGGNGRSFIYFGIGTWAATVLYYRVMANHPQITAFLIGLVVLHMGVLLVVKGELDYSSEFGLVTFISGIMVLLNSDFSEYMRKRKKRD